MDRNLDDKIISFYRAPISNCCPTVNKSVREIYDYIKHERAGVVTKLRSIKDETAAREYKAKSFNHCTFSGTFSYRSSDKLIEHSGLLCLDFDHLDDVEGVFQKLISDQRCPTALLFRSPSGDGLKWVVPIDVEQMSHEDWFYALSSYVYDAYGLVADGHCKDVARACFLPRDPNVYMDEDAFGKPLFVPDIPESEQGEISYDPAEDHFKMVVRKIEDAQIDIAPGYSEWLNLGFALCDHLGEEGRSYYHRLSRFNEGYKKDDTDRQYDKCLESGKEGITISSFYYMARRAGVDIGRVELPLPTFSPFVKEHLPYLLQQVCDLCQSAEEADMMILGSIVTLSATLPNICGCYDRRMVYPNLYLYVLAPASSGKGRLNLARQLVQPIHDQLLEQNRKELVIYRAQMTEYKCMKGDGVEKPVAPRRMMLTIPANSTATAMYQILNDNDGAGLLFETEGDTLANTFTTDHGNYSDGFRKMFHNEMVSYSRRQNDEHVEIKSPKLATVLSGTPSQLNKLIADSENGLFSRFIYYILPLKPEWHDVFADSSEVTLDEQYADLGQQWYDVYKQLSQFESISFSFTLEQKVAFNEYFDDLNDEMSRVYGDDIIPTVRRLGLIAFKIAMVLSAMRCLEFADYGKDLVCENGDFQIALTIVDTVIEHAARVYVSLSKSNPQKGNSCRQKEAEAKAKLYVELPETFQRKDAVELAKKYKISESTVKRWLKTGLFKCIDRGRYAKNTMCDPMTH